MRAGRRQDAEETAFEMGERGVRDLGVAGAELSEGAVCEARQQCRGLAQPFESRPPRLVRERHGHLGAPGERPDQRPLRLGEILEAVREDRSPVPRVELVCEAVGCGRPKLVAVPEAQPLELLAVRGVEARERAFEFLGLDEAGLDLTDRVAERVGEAAERADSPSPLSDVFATAALSASVC